MIRHSLARRLLLRCWVRVEYDLRIKVDGEIPAVARVDKSQATDWLATKQKDNHINKAKLASRILKAFQSILRYSSLNLLGLFGSSLYSPSTVRWCQMRFLPSPPASPHRAPRVVTLNQLTPCILTLRLTNSERRDEPPVKPHSPSHFQCLNQPFSRLHLRKGWLGTHTLLTLVWSSKHGSKGPVRSSSLLQPSAISTLT